MNGDLEAPLLADAGALQRQSEDHRRDAGADDAAGQRAVACCSVCPRNLADRHRRPRQRQSYLTEQDVQNYGNELIDVTQRAALQAVAPQLQEIEQQNAELQRRLAKEARRRLDQAVEMAVPNYREIDRDPRWHRWLLGVDVLSGRVRQQLLNEAISVGCGPKSNLVLQRLPQRGSSHGSHRASAVFPAASGSYGKRRYHWLRLRPLAGQGRQPAATPRCRPTNPFTHALRSHSCTARTVKVRMSGVKPSGHRQDADIIAAGREGRIR